MFSRAVKYHVKVCQWRICDLGLLDPLGFLALQATKGRAAAWLAKTNILDCPGLTIKLS